MSWANTYQNNHQRFLRVAERCSPVEDIADAEDLLQDAFVRLLESGRDADSLEKPESYAFKAIRNLGIDRCSSSRRLRPDQRVSIDDFKDDEEAKHPMMELRDPGRGPEMDALVKMENERLKRMLEVHTRDFTRREKTLLALHLQGLTNDQIALTLNEDVKAIRHDMNAMRMKLMYRTQKGK